MKLHSLFTCLVLGAALVASAQTAAPGQTTQASPTRKSETAAAWALPNTAENGALPNLRLQPGTLAQVVEQLQNACTKAAAEKAWNREAAVENLRKSKALVGQAQVKGDEELEIANKAFSRSKALAEEAKAAAKGKAAMERLKVDFEQAAEAYQRLAAVAKANPQLVAQQNLDDAQARRDAADRVLGAAREETAEKETAEAELSRAEAFLAQTKARIGAERDAAATELLKALESVSRYQMPTLIYGPGASEARVSGALDLVDVRPLDALAFITAAAGCILDPIYAPPLNREGNKQHILGYNIALASSRPSSPPPRTGSSTGGGESGGGDEVVGIGVALEKKDDNIVVGEVVPGSTADHMHVLKPGDRILKVNEDGKEDVDITGLPLEKVAKMILGKPGTAVELTIGATTEREMHRVRLVREKLNFTARLEFGNETAYTSMTTLDPLLSRPKVAVVDVGDTLVTSFNRSDVNPVVNAIDGVILPQGKAGDPASHPSPAASPDQDDVQIVRIYAIGSIFSGNDQDVKEDDFTKLVTQALDLAGLAKRAAPQLYFHAKSRVLVARSSARGHEIIEQLVNALRKSNEGLAPNPPEP